MKCTPTRFLAGSTQRLFFQATPLLCKQLTPCPIREPPASSVHTPASAKNNNNNNNNANTNNKLSVTPIIRHASSRHRTANLSAATSIPRFEQVNSTFPSPGSSSATESSSEGSSPSITKRNRYGVVRRLTDLFVDAFSDDVLVQNGEGGAKRRNRKRGGATDDGGAGSTKKVDIVNAEVTKLLQQTLQRLHTSKEDVTAALTTLTQLRSMSETRASWDIHARVLLNQSFVVRIQGQQEQAVSLLREAIHLYSSMGFSGSVVHARCDLGLLLSELGREQEATQCFQEAMGCVERSSASWEQAAAGCVATVALDGSYPSLCYARHLMRRNNYHEAEVELRKAFHTCGENIQTRRRLLNMLVRCLRAQDGKTEAAIELLEQELPSCIASAIAQDGMLVKTSTNSFDDQRERNMYGVSSVEARTLPLIDMATILHYEKQQPTKALPYYEAAVEMTLRVVREHMSVVGKRFDDPGLKHAIRVHAEVLFNAGKCIASSNDDTRGGPSRAVGPIEESIKLLSKIGDDSRTPHMRLQYANVLRQLDVLDEALHQYFRTIDIITAASINARLDATAPRCTSTLSSCIVENFATQSISLAEVHGHLAHCLHFNGSDFNRAHEHYVIALKNSGNAHAVRIVQSFAESLPERDAKPGVNADAEHQQQSAPVASPDPLRADILSWILECDADCLRRLQRTDDAISLLNLRLEIGRSVGDTCVSALFSLVSVLERDPNKLRETQDLYDFMVSLPQDTLTTSERLELVSHYGAFAHYTLHDFSTAAKLYEIALSLDTLNANMMVQYAWCARQVPEAERPSLEQLEKLYCQAVSAIELQKVEEHFTSQDSGISSSGKRGSLYDEVYVLGEAAMFYHDVLRDAQKAQLLYEKALQVPGVESSSSAVHVLANYAVLKQYVQGESAAADALFQKALTINPKSFVVANLYADFLINNGNEQGALQFVVQMIDLFPQHSSTIYHKLARLEERLGNMGDPESRSGVLRSFIIAVSGDRSLEVHDLAEDRIVELFSKCTNANIANDAIVFIQCKLKQLPLAKRCYEAVYHLFATHPVFLLNYGRLCMDLGDQKVAAQLFDEAFRLDPHDSTIVEQYADFIATRYPEQAAAVERLHLACIDAAPNNATAHLSYAIFLTLHLPSPAVATKHFREALKLQPNDATIWSQFAAFAERQALMVGSDALGFTDIMFEAEKAFKRACQLSPTAVNCLALGSFLWRSKRHDEAWGYLQQAYELEPNHQQVVASCAIFVHDKYIHAYASNHNSIQRSSSDEHETNQLKQLAELGEKLYKKALKLDVTDLHVVQQYVKFLEEVLKLPSAAREWQQHADELAAQKLKIHQQITPDKSNNNSDNSSE